MAPHIRGRGREVLVNFMYDHINRFIDSPDRKTEASLNPILGGPGWKRRLDPNENSGMAVEKLFRESLKNAGDFEFVLATRIDRPTEDRPCFFLVYGTKALPGLKAFRDAETKALKENYDDRARAKMKKADARTGTESLFGYDDVAHAVTFNDLVQDRMVEAKPWALHHLRERGGVEDFDDLCASVLEAFMLRETNVKDICVELEKEGAIEKTWTSQKPKSGVMIRLSKIHPTG